MRTPALSLVFHRWVFWRKPLAWRRLRLGLGLPVALKDLGLSSALLDEKEK